MNTSNEIIFFDVDGPLIRGFLQEALVTHLVRVRVMPFSDFLRIIYGLTLYKLHLLKNPSELFELGITYANGKTELEVRSILEQFLDTYLPKHLLKEGKKIIEDHQAEGRRVILLSSIIEPLVTILGTRLGVEEVVGTKMELQDGVYTGHILGKITHGKQKVVMAEELLQKYEADWTNSWAYADHDSDLPLLQCVAHPVAVNATKTVTLFVKEQGWETLDYTETL